ncbi:N-acetyltransferase [Demequina sp. NBRC 110056]|uniref:GNAT family N-acetyltransferase n=1 Tax=Demequina sp. NBRC 110056 TaxID=1570345 RepID=UPI000A03399A|nr:GNAT family N-acetyltransferase [Demequina sp. NBRC 110056]
MTTVVAYADAAPHLRDGLQDVFTRASEGSPAGALWGDAPSEAAVYLDPYIDHEPESLLLAVTDGAVVGYLAGSLGTASFPSESELIDAAMREHQLFRRRDTRAFFTRAMRDAAGAWLRRRPTARELDDPRWPAHLHIDLVPEARGTGVGDALMEAWHARLEAAGAPGCFLQTQVENERARRFFARHGYVDHGPAVLIPGVRHRGEITYQQTMVRDGAPAPHPDGGSHP